MLHAQQPYDLPEPLTPRLSAYSAVLTAHGVDHAIVSGRLFADAMVVGETGVDDLTDLSRPELFAWLGY